MHTCLALSEKLSIDIKIMNINACTFDIAELFPLQDLTVRYLDLAASP